MKRLQRSRVSAAVVLVLLAACSAGAESTESTSTEGAGAAAGTGGGGGAGPGAGGSGGEGAGFIETTSSGSGAGGSDTCLAEEYEGELRAVDILVVLDRSASMKGSLWDGSVAALTDFFNAPPTGDVSVGMNYFPPVSGAMCDVSNYDPPHVAVVPLATDSAMLVSEIQSAQPLGDYTPTYAALYGSLVFANERQDLYPERTVVVVLASDGDPTNCNTNLNDIAQLAAVAHAYNGVRTFVVAIQGADLAKLDPIAQSGGTVSSIDITSDVTLLKEKLDEISKKAVGCEFLIPEPTGSEKFEPTKLNINVTPSGSSTGETIPKVPGPGACGDKPGWYYDNELKPTKISFCPATCEAVSADAGAKVDFAFGCPTEVIK